jgi:hypothetical protein
VKTAVSGFLVLSASVLDQRLSSSADLSHGSNDNADRRSSQASPVGNSHARKLGSRRAIRLAPWSCRGLSMISKNNDKNINIEISLNIEYLHLA